jgi:hypothetical protein
MIKRLSATLLFTLVALTVFSSTASAIDDPDTAPQVLAVYVYEFNDGSVGTLIDYYLDYGTLPDETVTEAYLAVFVDTDGTTQLKSTAPYTFVDSGYGRGLAWIPFTAAEAAAYGLDSASRADYRIWLTGNPTLDWDADPPFKETTIGQWATSSVPETLASRILYYADVLELAWSLDMVEYTANGNRLTSVGASYFENVIPNCRTLAPDAFSDTTSDPDYIPVSYDTAFGATATSGTATVTGSPQTLTEGSDSVNVTTNGTIVIDLAQWTSGNITDDTGTLDGGPTIDLYPGVNTLTVTSNGTFTTELEVIDTAVICERSVEGTGFDLTDLGDAFGMSRWTISTIVWVIVTIIVCAAVYAGSRRSSLGADGGGASKVVMVVFAVMMVGGMLLGLLHPLVVSFMLIAYGAFIGYVLFFRSESLHKGMMFMIWMFVIVSIAGNIAASGQSGITATRLTDNITADETDSIPVASTAGFPNSGIIVIGDEQIVYPVKDDTHFLDATFNDIYRGHGGSTAAAHNVNASVRTKESYILNASIDYKIARITDSAGVLSFIAMPFLLLDLVFTFFKLPLEFLGTDLAILTYIWMVVAVGMIVGFVVALAGGRRV